jgi:hypothetical protein
MVRRRLLFALFALLPATIAIDAPGRLDLAVRGGALPAASRLAEARGDGARVLAEPQPAAPRSPGPPRVLFLMADSGGGHRASAEALAGALRELFDEDLEYVRLLLLLLLLLLPSDTATTTTTSPPLRYSYSQLTH